MIPVFEVLTEVPDWHGAGLREITADEWESGEFTNTQGYSPESPATWDEVAQALEGEADLLRHLDANASSGSEYEEVVDEIDRDWCGDVGTEGIVLALSAAGFWTFTSCSGHVGNRDWSVPFVGFVADEPHLEVLASLADTAECSLIVRPDGLVETFADTVSKLHRLASLILASQGEFAELGPVPFADD